MSIDANPIIYLLMFVSARSLFICDISVLSVINVELVNELLDDHGTIFYNISWDDMYGATNKIIVNVLIQIIFFLPLKPLSCSLFKINGIHAIICKSHIIVV